MIICPHCKIEKDLSEFHKTPHWCKKCNAARCKAYRKKNMEKFKEIQKAYRKKLVKEKGESWIYKRYTKKYKQSSKGKRTDKKWRERNADKINKNHLQYYYSDKGQQAYVKYYKENYGEFLTRNALRRARKKNAENDGSITAKSLATLFKNQSFRCNMCDLDLRIIGRHLDHIHPLSKGGSHTIDNVQYLCSNCNCSKQDKILTPQ